MSRTRVAAVQATPETILEDVRRVARLVGWPFPTVRPGRLSVVVKGPERDDSPGASSSPWILDGTLRLLAESYRSPAPPPLIELGGRAPRAASRLRPVLRAGQSLLAPQPSNLDGRDLIVLAPLQLGGSWGVHAATALAHETGATSADRGGKNEPERVAETLAALYERSRPRLWIVDGTVCGWRGGRNGHSTIQNLLLASEDPLVIDLTIARLVGLEVEQLPWLRDCLAVRRGQVAEGFVEVVGESLSGLRLGPELDLAAPRAAARGRAGRFLAWSNRVLDRIACPPWIARARSRSYWRSPWGRLEKSYASRERS